ncbi:MAG TPA: glycosyltransferase family 2 protein [Thermoanaerobaculia bacterium]
MTSTTRRVAAIVPAYNEQETLAEVLTVLKAIPLIDEVLVVSDGSTDETVAIARGMKLKTIHLRENHGKGTAMAVGVAHASADILVFVDGDILNLTEGMLEQLIRPVLDGRSDMNVGIRNRGRILNAIHQTCGPLLSGIRCLRREIFEAVPEEQLAGFAVETGLNWSCRQLGMRTTTTLFFHLKHLVKEKKRGLWRGARARVTMFASVFHAYLSLVLTHPGLRRPDAASPLALEREYVIFS